MPDRGTTDQTTTGPQTEGSSLGLRDLAAAILAGGLGTRLRSVVPDRPKVLAQVNGRPVLTYLLDQVAAAGIKRAVLCTGYFGEQVQHVLGETYEGMQLVYSQEPTPCGTAGALALAAPLLQSDPVFVMNGDSYCDVDLAALWQFHQAKQAAGSVVLANVPDASRYGCVELDEDGHLLRFVEKRDTHAGNAASATPVCNGTRRVPAQSAICIPAWINAGIYLLACDLLGQIPTARAVSLERELFPCWIGRRLYGYCSDGAFVDIGTPESYSQARPFFARLRA